MDQALRQPCGNGGQCFGVDRCLLPENQPCTGDDQCGSGQCEQRLGGTGQNDRICCLTDCGARGQQCNASGQCQDPTLPAGAACGAQGQLPCAAGLECKSCLGGGRQCQPPDVCCGGCGTGCNANNTCECNAAAGFRNCGAGCVQATCCSSTDCGGRACNNGTCAAAECSANQRRCLNGVPQVCGQNGLFVSQAPCGNGTACTNGICAECTVPGNACSDCRVCSNNLTCVLAPLDTVCGPDALQRCTADGQCVQCATNSVCRASVCDLATHECSTNPAQPSPR